MPASSLRSANICRPRLLLRERAAPLTVSTGVAALDALTGGLPRGALSEITGPASSGRTGVMLAALAGATRREEACALVDASDNFDPASAAAAGVDLERLLWVRCGEPSRSSLRKDQRRRRAGTPGTSAESDRPAVAGRRLWHGRARPRGHSRGKRAPRAAHFVVSFSPGRGTHRNGIARGGAGAVRENLRLAGGAAAADGSLRARFGFAERNRISRMESFGPRETSAIPPVNVVSHAALLRGMQLRAEVVRSWTQRKPMHSVGADFELRAAW